MKTMTVTVPTDRCLGDRRKLLQAIRRIHRAGHVDVLPAEQWPAVAAITVPVFTEQQREQLEQLGFRSDES